MATHAWGGDDPGGPPSHWPQTSITPAASMQPYDQRTTAPFVSSAAPIPSQQQLQQPQAQLSHSQSPSLPSSYALHSHPSNELGLESGSARPSALPLSSSSASPPHPQLQAGGGQEQLSQSASPHSNTESGNNSSSNGGGDSHRGQSRRSKSILRKVATPTGHRRGVSFSLPQEYLEDKERARAAATAEAAARKARALEEEAAAQATQAALLTAQMSSPYVYPQEGLSAAPLPSTAASVPVPHSSLSGSGFAPTPALMSRQQKTAFHPLTTPSSSGSSGSSRTTMLAPMRIHPATAAANAAKAAQSQSQAHALAASSVGATAVPSPNGTHVSRRPQSTPSPPPSAALEAGALSPTPRPHHPSIQPQQLHRSSAHASTYMPAASNVHPRSATSTPTAPAWPDNRNVEYSFPSASVGTTTAAGLPSGSQYSLQPFQAQSYSHSTPTSPAGYTDAPLVYPAAHPTQAQSHAQPHPQRQQVHSAVPAHQPISNALPRLSLGNMATPVATPTPGCSPFSSGSNSGSNSGSGDDSTPMSASSSSSSSAGFGSVSGGGGDGGGSALYVRPSFPQGYSGSGPAVPAAASSAFSLRGHGGGSGGNGDRGYHSTLPSNPSAATGSYHGSNPTARSHPQAPPSPSKLARPLSFSWNSASSSQSCSASPWAYCSQYLLPHLLRVVRSRRMRRRAILRIAGALALFVCLVMAALYFQPERTLTMLPGGSGERIRSLAEDWSLVSRDDTSGAKGSEGEQAIDADGSLEVRKRKRRPSKGILDKITDAWIGVGLTKGGEGGTSDAAGAAGRRSDDALAGADDEEDPLLDDDLDLELDQTTSPPLFPSLRECGPTDLECRLESVPFYPSASGGDVPKRRVLLVVVNAGFREMALNLVCSADMVGGGGSDSASGSNDRGGTASAPKAEETPAPWSRGEIPRAAWLIACADNESYEFFLARGIAAVRMNATSALTPPSPAAPATDEAVAAASAATPGSSSNSIGSSASSWGTATHININREKVPLLHTLLLHGGVDVVLIDADVVFLHGLRSVFDESHGGPLTDLAVMFDHPHTVSTPPFGSGMSGCMGAGAWSNTSAVCRSAWEMNGGFFLLRSNTRTQALLAHMIEWLRARPSDHDQDAMRFVLRQMAAQGKLAWRTEAGTLYPPPPFASAASATSDGSGPALHSGVAESDVLSYRFISPLLAPNGGLFLLGSRQAFLEASVRAGLLEPHALHVNWVVGYERKRALMQQYGLWFVARARSLPPPEGSTTRASTVQWEAQCAHVMLAARKDNLQQLEAMLRARGAVTDPIGTTAGPTNASTALSSAQLAAMRAQALQRAERSPVRPPPGPTLLVRSASDLMRLDRRPASVHRGPAPLLILGTAPKPVRSFLRLPPSREADSDGLGAYDAAAPEHQYAAANVAAYMAAQRVQLHAQAQCFRNWFALTHTASASSAAGAETGAGQGVHVAVFSSDPSHAQLARRLRMDVVSHYETDAYEMPLLRSVFRTLESLARARAAPLVAYSNGDLLYEPDELARTVAAVERYGFAQWMGVGMRNNVEPPAIQQQESETCRGDREELVRILLKEIEAEMEAEAARKGTTNSTRRDGSGGSDSGSSTALPAPLVSLLHAHRYFHRLHTLSHPFRSDALDYFIWTPGFFEWDLVPPFVLGRIGFDNWMLHYANTKARASMAAMGGGMGGGVVVVDMSQTVRALHVNHGNVVLEPVEVVSEARVAGAGAATDADAAREADPLSQMTLATAAAAGPSGSAVLSHFQPNSLTNLKLSGQASLRGLGDLRHANWRTEALHHSGAGGVATSAEIRVVKVRPEGGHIAELYDAAREAHVLVHGRPALLLLTVDEAHVDHLRNWMWHMRRALRRGGPTRPPPRRRNRNDAQTDGTASRPLLPKPDRTGVLVLSAGPLATTAARQLGLSVFELAPGGARASAGLNGPASANLHILSLRSRATALLIEYGYDVFVVPVSGVWKRNPWKVVAERAVLQQSYQQQQGQQQRQRRGVPGAKRTSGKRRQVDPSAVTAAHAARLFDTVSSESSLSEDGDGDGDAESGAVPPSFDPVSSETGLALLAGPGGVDLLAVAYDSAPFNVSSGAVLYRHTPATLRLWRRMLQAHQALVARASLTPPQVNWNNLQLDWYLQHELYAAATSASAPGAELVWARLTMDAGLFDMDESTLAAARRRAPSGTLGADSPLAPVLPHVAGAPLRDRDLVLANGWFHDRQGGLGAQWAQETKQRLRDAGVWEERSQTARGGVLISSAANGAGSGGGGGSRTKPQEAATTDEESEAEVETEELDPCLSGMFDCGSLSSLELDLLLSVCSVDQSVALLPLPSSAPSRATEAPASPPPPSAINEFLDRAREVGFSNLVLVAASRDQLQAHLSAENLAHGFVALLGPGTSASSFSSSAGGGGGAPKAGSSAPSLFSLRLWQVLQRGFHVGLFNPSSALLWGNPFDFYTNIDFEVRARDRIDGDGGGGGDGELDAHRPHLSRRAFEASQGVWSSLSPSASPTLVRPLSDLECDLHAPPVSTVSPEHSQHRPGVRLGATSTAWTFVSVQPTIQSGAWAAQLVACTAGSADASDSGLPLACMDSLASSMQSRGGLSVCPLDPHLFPSTASSFEPPSPTPLTPPSPLVSQAAPTPGRGKTLWTHVVESGVWPLVGARAFENPRTGRLVQWDAAWRQKNAAAQSSNADACPPQPRAPVLDDEPPRGAPGQQAIRCEAPQEESKSWFGFSSSSPPSSSTPGSKDVVASFMFTIRVLTYTRASSLDRLLRSLVAADYLGDGQKGGQGKVRLEVWVDRPEGSEEPAPRGETREAQEKRQKKEMAAAVLRAKKHGGSSAASADSNGSPAAQRDAVLSLLHSFHWPHGPLSITLHARHVGLVGQWLGGDEEGEGDADGQPPVGSTLPRSDRDLTLVLEDDLEVSPHFYSWVRGAICAYYLPATPSQFNPRLFGLSLQRQHYVLGQSAKNAQVRFMRFQEEMHKAERAKVKGPTDEPPASAPGAMSASDAIDPAALLDVQGAAGDPQSVPAFRYQLLGTWGLLVFPTHWRPFRAWARAHMRANDAAMAAAAAAAGGASVAAPVDPSSLPFAPCVPHLECSQWWSSKPRSVWSAWFVRYMWEQGWYGLYPRLPDRDALVLNHREVGENYKRQGRGARDTMLMLAPPPASSAAALLAPSPASGGRFRFPPLRTLPLFDFHLQRVTLDPVVLAQRSATFTPAQLQRSCNARDYKQFE